MQVYSRLNHVSVCISYSVTLNLVDSLSVCHTLPLTQWISNDIAFKYCGDNADKERGVCDVCSNHQGELLHMYCMCSNSATGCSRTLATHVTLTRCPPSLSAITMRDVLPSTDDIKAVKSNLIILVGANEE